jgi:RimJ/RimL family protein N-acetyltransferase
MTSFIVETPRLVLRRLTPGDAPFIRRLVNDPDWLRYIGDKNVHSDDDALRYLETGPLGMYRRLGFGLYAVELKEKETLIGMCGLLKRDMLDDVDLGFALLPEFRGRGYAGEAAAGALAHGRALGLKRIVAIATPDNDASKRLLKRLGFAFERVFETPDNPERLQLWGIDLESPAGAR